MITSDVWSKTDLPDTLEFFPVIDQYIVNACQAAGAAWIQSGRQLAVQVPSLVIPVEPNVLLNTTHPTYRTLERSEPQPFRSASVPGGPATTLAPVPFW